MSNVAHVNANFYLRLETDLSEEEYTIKFNKETLAGAIVQLVLADGSVHKASFADLLSIETEEFEEEEKPLSVMPSDQNKNSNSHITA